VDGQFQEQLSNLPKQQGLRAESLAEAMHSDRAAVEPYLGKHAPYSGDAFRALNTAFLTDGGFVRVDAGAEIEQPVQLLFITSAAEASRAIYPRILWVSGENSGSTLIETYVNLAETPQLTDSVAEIVLGHGARLRHYRVQIEHEKSHHIGIERIYQAGDSTYTSTSYATGPAIGRYDIHNLLDAPGGECTLHGLYLTTNRQHQSNEISTTHAKPRCKSHQFFKGVLAGRSQAVFSGKVIVQVDAQKSEADQKDLNLLLSHGAEIDTKPALEIYADDVKAGHGATAGHVDPDAMFYMQSRGLSLDEARAMLVRGFIGEIVDEFEPESLHAFVERKTEEVMPALLAAAD
jgi:Fe-S cluster assembly protein SufD